MLTMSRRRVSRRRYKQYKVTIEDIAIDLLPYAYKIILPAVISLILVSLVSIFFGKYIAKILIGIRTLSPVFFFNQLLESGVALPSAIIITGLILWYKKQPN